MIILQNHHTVDEPLTLCLLGILGGGDMSVLESPFATVVAVVVTAGGWSTAALLPDSDEALSTLVRLAR